MQRALAVRAVIVPALAVAVTTGCTEATVGTTGPSVPSAPSAPSATPRSTALGGPPVRLADHPPDAPAVHLSEKPLWSDKTTDSFRRAARLDIRGESVILAGADAKGEARGVAVLDARTGNERWSLEWDDELPGGDGAVLEGAITERLPVVAGDDEDWSVVVPYHRAQPGMTWEQGLAVLEPDDGTVRTKVVLHAAKRRRPPEPEPTGNITMWRVGGDSVAALTTPLGLDGAEPGSRTVVADLRTGEVLWEKKDGASFSPHAVLAIVVRGLRKPSRYDRTVAFVRGTDGHVLGRVKGGARCGPGGVSIVCVILDGTTPRLLTLRGGTREPVVSARKVQFPADFPRIGLGRVFMYDPEAHSSTVYDDAGNVLGRDLPGRLGAITDRYVALLDDRPDDTDGRGAYPGYALYRLS